MSFNTLGSKAWDFGGNTHEALIALCAALFSIVVYSVIASLFGIPTSESHSLIAGLSGAAIAIQSGIGGINMDEWVKVLYGLVSAPAWTAAAPTGSSNTRRSWAPPR